MEKLRTSLGNRLKCVASFVENGETIADIGTDHAYLPAYLVTNGICPSAIASDIGEGPIQNAQKIVDKTGTDGKIKLLISDGLDMLSVDDADVFIFAGMGGTLIVNLLDRTPWIKDNSLKFVFQPMSRSEELIEYLIKNGFEITEEKACFEGGRCYIVFCALFTEKEKEYPECFPYVGLLDGNSDDASTFYLKRQCRLLEKKLKALEESDIDRNEQAKLRLILKQMEEYV